MTKTGLRGFALGIFISCALVALYTYFLAPTSHSKSTTQSGKTPLTSQNVEQYLANHGKIAVDQATFTKWQSAEQKTSGPSSKTNTQSKSSGSGTPSSSSTTNTGSTNTVIKTTLNITNGMDVWAVANQLKQDNIIKDPQALYDYMLKNNLDKYLQLGTFNLSSSMTLSQIAHAISK